jgi:hypothetical protein
MKLSKPELLNQKEEEVKKEMSVILLTGNGSYGF